MLRNKRIYRGFRFSRFKSEQRKTGTRSSRERERTFYSEREAIERVRTLHRNERGLIEPLFGRRGSQCSRGQRVFTERGSERHGPTRERSVPFRDDEDVSKEQGIRVSMDDYETIFMQK